MAGLKLSESLLFVRGLMWYGTTQLVALAQTRTTWLQTVCHVLDTNGQ